MQNNEYQKWEEYKKDTLSVLTPMLKDLGFVLEQEQPHVSGERYLMQAITTESGRKLIMLGRRINDNMRVVIKVTRDKGGVRELEHERICRNVLHKMNFAHGVFFSPNEVLFVRKNGYTISIQTFIEQERPFLERTLQEQFMLALKAFKSQEGARATTYSHGRMVSKTFGQQNATQYINAFESFVSNTAKARADDGTLHEILANANSFLKKNYETIEQYGGFLTHTDFVPHNFRVVNNVLYLLDNSSLRFGNKYEGWARFINFMTLYNPELGHALVEYVHLNRTPKESLSLKLMRVYRLGEIIWYYVNTLDKCSGDLRELNEERVRLWGTVLKSVLCDENVSADYLKEYRAKRDVLRSKDEKQRQYNLH